MQYGIKSPCKECPFRANSIPGWLGPDSPDEVVQHVLGMHDLGGGVFVGGEPRDYACHMDIDNHTGEDGDVNEDAVNHCAGALHFLRTSCKQPRDPAKADAAYKVKPTVPMLKNYNEFLKHHKR